MPEMSRLPSTLRQEDVAFHVPTTVPPHGVTFEQDAVAAPPVPGPVPALGTVPVPAVGVVDVPAVGAVPPVPVDVPAVPGGGSEVTLQAPEITANAVAV